MPTKANRTSSDYVDLLPFLLRMVTDRVFAAKFDHACRAKDFAAAKRLVKASGVTKKVQLFTTAEHHALKPSPQRTCFKFKPDGPYFCTGG